MAFEVVERKTQFAVIGLGIFGINVAKNLAQGNAEVIAVDKDPANVDKIKDYAVYPFVLDSTNEDALREAGIDNVDCAIVAIGVDMVGSILTTLLLKKFKIPRIIARANTEAHVEILKLIGVTEIIQPEVDTASKLATRLIEQHGFLLSYENIWGDHAIVEVKVNNLIVNKTLAELDFRKRFKVNVIAIKKVVERLDDQFRNVVDFEIEEVPDPHKPLQENEILIIVGKSENVNRLNAELMRKK